MTNIELETMSLIKQACKKYSNEKIDWEERTFEMAKDFFFNVDGTTISEAVNRAKDFVSCYKELMGL